MASELTPIDITRVPGLAHLVEEVRTTRKPRRITRGDEDVAILMPASARRRRRDGLPRAAAIDAAIALAGVWQDQLDPETFKRERRELQVDDKPPRSL